MARKYQVSVVVPWHGTCPHRERAFAWVKARYAAAHPAWEVVVGVGGDPWCKAAAVEDGLSRASGDVLVVADADVWCQGLQAAVDVLGDGAAWVVPHLSVHRFNEAATRQVLDGADPGAVTEFDEDPYHGWVGGGLVVLRREDYWRAPLDHRFRGWGNEDASWGHALEAIVGPHVRLDRPLCHLWHPPQQRMSRRVGNPVSEDLWRRYRSARGRPDRMAALVAEGRGGGARQARH